MLATARKLPDTSSLSHIDADDTALFLDFDGVIADIVDAPDKVRVEPDVLGCLQKMSRASGNALAIVSGREIAQIDSFLQPLRLPAAGVHGIQHRNAAGETTAEGFDEKDFCRLRHLVVDFAEAHDGLLAEVKPGSVALHYRYCPEMEADCRRLASELESMIPGMKTVRGKMVVDMKLADRTKGDAIARFMDEPPFRHRIPLFFGDDVTDEDGFRIINALGGISVKIGDGESEATCRLASTAEFRRWLADTADRWTMSRGGTRRLEG